MRFAIIGTGGVGGYFGGLLARDGEDVTFIARGEHLAAIRERGLQVESIHGDFTVRDARATDRPEEVGPVDAVLFATKTHQLEAAAEAMKPMIGPRTLIVPLHNGIDSAERTAAVVGPEHVVGGLCYVGSMIAAPGIIRQNSPFRRVIAGELPGSTAAPSGRLQPIVDALAATGVAAEISDDIQAARWSKFAFIAPFSAVGAATRVPAGEMRDLPDTRALLHDAIREVVAVARLSGVNVAADLAEQTIAFFDSLPPHMMASMQRDVLDGRPSELDSMVGVVARMGRQLGAETPVFRALYAALQPQERRSRAAR
jgi:2-dehydropantoate 2-reductase